MALQVFADERRAQMLREYLGEYRNGIECPKCACELVDTHKTDQLQFMECRHCDWEGSRWT